MLGEALDAPVLNVVQLSNVIFRGVASPMGDVSPGKDQSFLTDRAVEASMPSATLGAPVLGAVLG